MDWTSVVLPKMSKISIFIKAMLSFKRSHIFYIYKENPVQRIEICDLTFSDKSVTIISRLIKPS